MTLNMLSENVFHPLRQHWLEHPENFAGLRQVETAQALGVSEGEWVEACRGFESTRLVDDAKAFLEALPGLGPVMALTRNGSAVHEKNGQYDHILFFEKMGMAQVVNHDIDLRIFLKHWYRIYAVTADKNGVPQHSLQVFDAEGRAVHKIFQLEGTDRKAWEGLVERLRSEDTAPFSVAPIPVEKTAAPESVDVDAFHSAWDGMRDTHEFFLMLRRYNLHRLDALRLAGEERAMAVAPGEIPELLRMASRDQVPIMVFVGNRGCIQIHTGRVENVVRFGDWINVMDPGFNLHLRDHQIAEAWVVRKQTADGVVTSVELYDADRNEIVMFFGERKPGIPERSDWRSLVAAALSPLCV